MISAKHVHCILPHDVPFEMSGRLEAKGEGLLEARPVGWIGTIESRVSLFVSLSEGEVELNSDGVVLWVYIILQRCTDVGLG